MTMSHSNSLSKCEKLLILLSNGSMSLNENELSSKSIRQFRTKNNSFLLSSRTIEQCLELIEMMKNSSTEWKYSSIDDDDRHLWNEHSSSLIIFILLITFVSLISIIGNLSLAKILFSKRDRLIQTDRIVLCLALSELCLVLIDSPTEIYRFLSYSFTIDWLCRFHTFFESLFSSCIIFYHLLGAFDRFVYLHGNISSRNSHWSNIYQYLSNRSGSIILLIIPLICSFPLSISNYFHANIIYTSTNNKICIVQYNHRLLISLLVSFYLIPLIVSFIFHGKLIYLICKRHESISSGENSLFIPMKMKTNKTSNQNEERRRNENRSNKSFGINSRDYRLNRSITTTTNENIRSIRQGTLTTSASSRSSSNIRHPSSTMIFYKINSQANANANRTVILFVLLLSFYVFCWAPYNLYTWYQAYQLTHRLSSTTTTTSLNSKNDSSEISFNLHSNLRRIIFINYSLYLLSMVSMCFSFIFYFTLNKQGRIALKRWLSCLCPKIRYEKNSIRSVGMAKAFDDRIIHHHHQYYLDENLRFHRSPQQQQQSNIIGRYEQNISRTLTIPTDRCQRRFISQQQRIQLNKTKKSSRNYQFQIQCCP